MASSHDCQCGKDGSLDKLRLFADHEGWPYTEFDPPVPFVQENLPEAESLIVLRQDGHPTAVVEGVIRDIFDASEGGTALLVGYWQIA